MTLGTGLRQFEKALSCSRAPGRWGRGAWLCAPLRARQRFASAPRPSVFVCSRVRADSSSLLWGQGCQTGRFSFRSNRRVQAPGCHHEPVSDPGRCPDAGLPGTGGQCCGLWQKAWRVSNEGIPRCAYDALFQQVVFGTTPSPPVHVGAGPVPPNRNLFGRFVLRFEARVPFPIHTWPLLAAQGGSVEVTGKSV